jgi:hypothetical protein
MRPQGQRAAFRDSVSETARQESIAILRLLASNGKQSFALRPILQILRILRTNRAMASMGLHVDGELAMPSQACPLSICRSRGPGPVRDSSSKQARPRSRKGWKEKRSSASDLVTGRGPLPRLHLSHLLGTEFAGSSAHKRQPVF